MQRCDLRKVKILRAVHLSLKTSPHRALHLHYCTWKDLWLITHSCTVCRVEIKSWKTDVIFLFRTERHLCILCMHTSTMVWVKLICTCVGRAATLTITVFESLTTPIKINHGRYILYAFNPKTKICSCQIGQIKPVNGWQMCAGNNLRLCEIAEFSIGSKSLLTNELQSD